ncbi:MAG TPA: 7TM diverse intracellular signaling domain-containing protein, partial [Bacillota bacterium]|nr:7TM diverse intracellular signaling domain-containing protein [Bacillota bacterium]
MKKGLIDTQRILLLLSGIVITGVVFICLFFAFPKQDSHRIYPTQGRLDLQNWDPRRDGTLNLNGEWDFYWRRFLSYQEIVARDPTPDLKAVVPDVWNNYKLRGKNLPGFGYATYRLRVTGVAKGISLALRIPTFSTAYKLFINHLLVSTNGKAGSSKRQSTPQYRPEVVEFTPDGASFELIAQVANFTYSRGGMWYTINLGTPEQIHQLDRTIADKDLLLFGALAVMALYYLSIFLLRREDKSSLYFVLMCLMLASRTAVYGDYLIYRLVPFISFQAIIAIEYITVCWFPIFAVLMVAKLFPEEASQKVLKAAVVYGVIMA